MAISPISTTIIPSAASCSYAPEASCSSLDVLRDRQGFIHCSTVVTLIFMKILGDYRLRCTGDLLREGIAPQYGECNRGIDPWGVNIERISGGTLKMLGEIKQYTSMTPFSPDPQIFKSILIPKAFERVTTWNYSAVRLMQLKQWNMKTFQEIVLPLQNELLDVIKNKRDSIIIPLQRLIAIIEYPQFTEEEILFIQNYWERKVDFLSMPERLKDLFPSGELLPIPDDLNITFDDGLLYFERKFQESGNSGYHVFTMQLTPFPKKDVLEQYILKDDWRYTAVTFDHLIVATIHKKLTGYLFQGGQKALYTREQERIERSYQYIFKALEDSPSRIQIPEDPEIRSLILNPFGVIYGSTKAPHILHPSGNEHISKTLPLGSEGIDVLIVPTQTEKDHVLKLIPEELHSQVSVHFYDEVGMVSSSPRNPPHMIGLEPGSHHIELFP